MAKAKKKTAKKKTVKKATPAKKRPATKKKQTKKKTPKKTVKKKAPTKKTAKKKYTKKKSAKKKVTKKPGKKTPAKKKAAKKKVVKKTAVKAAKRKAIVKKATKKRVAIKKKAVGAAATTAAAVTPTSAKPTRSVKVQLGKQQLGTFPEGSSPNDFQCFGPPATRDGQFDGTRICDMGCFTQDGKDSNKYYHGAVVQNKLSHNWYAYFEWGRTGAARPAFQFVGCSDESHASREYAKQLHSKNDRRGEWVTIAGLQTLRARKGKDCYLVRPQATRSTGLPDARSIKTNEGAKEELKPVKKGKKKKAPAADPQTMSLMRDLTIATVAYTRGSMADDSIPTQTAIDEARDILSEAQSRLGKLGDKVKKQVKDRQLKQLTTLMYSRIPKLKPVGAPPETWILSQDNILNWRNDLDAFESALYSTDIEHEPEFDPFEGMRLKMEWVDPSSKAGKFLHKWWPTASNNRHSYIRDMRIKNLWSVQRDADQGKLEAAQDEILSAKPKIGERASFQPKKRDDLPKKEQKRFADSNTSLLFHGTRSVNVSGILRESLRMPKQLVGVVITGAMFGPGIYFADDWKKSAGYTSLTNSYWSGGSGAVKGREAFMFAVEVALGNPYVAPKWGGYTSPPDGHHCVYGKSGASGVQNNEFIIYKPEQHRLRYLAEFSTK